MYTGVRKTIIARIVTVIVGRYSCDTFSIIECVILFAVGASCAVDAVNTMLTTQIAIECRGIKVDVFCYAMQANSKVITHLAVNFARLASFPGN